MNRSDWLKQIRREAEVRYDTFAPLYGDKYGIYSNETHRQFIQLFLSLLPVHSHILDAACGAGRYLPTLIEKGHVVIGVDQSQGMLSRAKGNFPNIQFEKVSLQDLRHQEAFDGAICMDAMEHVCPEDWSLVLGNLYRALKPNGYLYFTVEIADDNEVKMAFIRNQQMGLPVVYGEWPDEDVYHYYPSARQVKVWIQQVGLVLFKEGDGDGYHHLIVHKTSEA